jgi:hypothetical protein
MKTRLVVNVHLEDCSKRKHFQKDELDEHLAGLLLQVYIAHSNHAAGSLPYWLLPINLAHIPGKENKLVSGKITNVALFLLKKFQAPFFQVDIDCELNSEAEFSEAVKAFQEEEGWTTREK